MEIPDETSTEFHWNCFQIFVFLLKISNGISVYFAIFRELKKNFQNCQLEFLRKIYVNSAEILDGNLKKNMEFNKNYTENSAGIFEI